MYDAQMHTDPLKSDARIDSALRPGPSKTKKKRPGADATEAVAEIADHSSSGSNINLCLSTTLPSCTIGT